MTIRLFLALPTALCVLVSSLWTPLASAQVAVAAVPPSNPVPLASPAAKAQTALPAYHSALEGYHRYTDEKMVDWKEANDATARIGGWRAYAKEASQAQAEDSTAKPGAGATPAQP